MNRRTLKTIKSTSVTKDKHLERNKRDRPIGFVIMKVMEWRKVYHNHEDHNNLYLIDAAKEVGMSKKSLEYYQKLLRRGRSLGFDFNLHKISPSSKLIAFLKENEDNDDQLVLNQDQDLFEIDEPGAQEQF